MKVESPGALDLVLSNRTLGCGWRQFLIACFVMLIGPARHARSHVYLEMGDNRNGSATVKCSATIWRSAAGTVLDFEVATTGARFAAGVNLLVCARSVIKAMFGFRLEIEAIDPTYTPGDLEARKHEIQTVNAFCNSEP